MLPTLFSLYLKMLVLYSPFFVLSCFIGLTPGYSTKERKRLAWKVALGTLISSVLLYLFGQTIFEIFGITADAFRIGADGRPVKTTNHAGGILGGISTGQNIEVSMALKPASSITTPGKSINTAGEEVVVVTKGRHDPCVGIRAVPIAEAMLALVLMDHYLRHKAQCMP